MIPIYRYMDSQPFQKNQMPFGQYQYPGMETIPSHVMMDSTKSRTPHDYWSNSGYGYTMPFYSCCNSGNFPGYYCFRHPHLHVPPHPHMPCYGGYPPCPEPYYVQYVPRPHYNMEQPRYEFDKNMRNHHCCGCPNSLCGQNQKEDKNMKIEEEPNIQRNGSLFPIQFGNNQCPIVWIPPDYTESKKEREPSETETAKQKKEVLGWPPSDMSRLGTWLPDVEGMKVQGVQNKQHEDEKKQLPFPIIWMPAFGGQDTAREDVQNMNTTTKATEEPPDAKKLIPASIFPKDDDSNEFNRFGEKSISEEGPEVVKKTVNQSSIPVKEMNHNETVDTKKKKERRCIPVEYVEDNVERESSGTNVKEQSSSLPKKPRLPPVCLRVVPFPKKKNCNGNSRSQSPTKELTSSTGKENSQQDSKINDGTSIVSKPIETGREKIIKPVEVKTHENLNANHGDKENISSTGEPVSLPTKSQEKFLDKLFKEETGDESTNKEFGEKDKILSDYAPIEKVVEDGLEINSVDLVGNAKKTVKPCLSDVEAAVLIQSAYRGYGVRKWELRKKWRQIAKVRQLMIEVQNRVTALESAPQDEKRRMFIGETIMRLLLKLDTIQGLHPSVREFRKSLAKELVALQEKLDCIMTNIPTDPVQEVVTDKHTEHCNVEIHDNETEPELKKDEVTGIGEYFSEGVNENNVLLVTPHGAQPLCGIDDMGSFEGVESPTKKERERLAEDGYKELREVNDDNTKVSEAEQLVELIESGFQNEDTSNLSPQNFSQQLSEDGEVLASLIGGEKPEEAESGAEMEPNVVVTDAEHTVGEIIEADTKEETSNEPAYSCEVRASPEDPFEAHTLNSISDNQVEGAKAEPTSWELNKISTFSTEEYGQTENLTAAEMEELPMREVVDSFEADKIEHVETRNNVLQVEENKHNFEFKSSEGGDRIPCEKQPEEQEGCHAEDVGSEQREEFLNYSMGEVGNKGAYDESADLPLELSNCADDIKVQNEKSIKKKERQTVDKEEKVMEDLQQERCGVDLMPSCKLDNQAYESHSPKEKAMDKISIEGEGQLMPLSTRDSVEKNDLGSSDKELDKKLAEENEKMREMVEKLMEAGKEQLTIISKLSGRVKDLEKKLARKKKLRRGHCSPMAGCPMLSRRVKV